MDPAMVNCCCCKIVFPPSAGLNLVLASPLGFHGRPRVGAGAVV
jgi:hypothetical protein